MLLIIAGCGEMSPASPRHPAPAADPAGGSWTTWVIPTGSALRPPPPPAPESEQARAELSEIVALQHNQSDSVSDAIKRWNEAPTVSWTDVALDRLDFYWPLLSEVRVATPVRSTRIMALLHAAMYDAMVAAWDAKFAYNRVAPALADNHIRAEVDVTALPSYPSEHAAAAAAAALVLAYAFPADDSSHFAAMAREASESRIAAGANYRSDVEAGLALGTAVAKLVIDRARHDGSDVTWTGTAPQGQFLWRPTPPRRVKIPFDPMAGSWQTWVLTSGSQYRPDPPPLPGAARFDSSLNEIRQLSTKRTAVQADTARYWGSESPSALWEVFMLAELRGRHTTALRAARAQAMASIAAYDALVACWDAKFHYWLERPISADSSVVTVFSTPPFPSYPSGHSTQSAAQAEVFAYLFPDSASVYRTKAHAASRSRVIAGIHYRFDTETGEELGRKVGEAVVAKGKKDGAGG
jgi:membrane-associated phospholipid phosphatase